MSTATDSGKHITIEDVRKALKQRIADGAVERQIAIELDLDPPNLNHFKKGRNSLGAEKIVRLMSHLGFFDK